jgi:hypothetical protein
VAATGLEVTIQLPPPAQRPWGLLVDVAHRIPAESLTYPGVNAPASATTGNARRGQSRLGLGVQHVPWGCAPLRRGNLDCSADYLINQSGPAVDEEGDLITANIDDTKASALIGYDEVTVHPAFKVVDGLQCSTLSFPDDTSRNASMVNRLQNRMRRMISHDLANELVTGFASGGPSLSSEAQELFPLFGGIHGAIATIEGHLGFALPASQGCVLVPPAILPALVDAGWVIVVGASLMTVTGHMVIADSGFYGGTGPGGVDSGLGEYWVYATSTIGWAVSDTRLLGDTTHDTLDVASNIRERLAEAYAQVAFEPCSVAAVLFDMNAGS